MRNFLVVVVLIFVSMPMFAKDKNAQPTENFTIQSVMLSGDTCYLTLNAGDHDTITYHVRGWAHVCNGLKSGQWLSGRISVTNYPFSSPSSVTDIYFVAGISEKGKLKWSAPFIVDTQSM